jgi:hypothetical protein
MNSTFGTYGKGIPSLCTFINNSFSLLITYSHLLREFVYGRWKALGFVSINCTKLWSAKLEITW